MIDCWHYQRIDDFELPGERAKSVRLGLRRFWRRRVARLFGSTNGAQESTRGDLLSEAEVADLVPSLDVVAAAAGLLRALEPWPDPEASRSAVSVVGPLGSHHAEVLRHLARDRGWRVVEPPTRSELWAQGEALDRAVERLSEGLEEPLVIPELGRWLLRCDECLPAMRAVLARLADRRSPLLVGCGSWAWTYLEHTVGVRGLLGEPWVMAAFDAEMLESWLGGPLERRQIECRAYESWKEPVFRDKPADGKIEGGLREGSVSSTLERLATAARGNPAVAAELWRLSLRRIDGDDRGPALGVVAVDDCEPVLQRVADSMHHFILHAILLHGDLEEETLIRLLPFSQHELRDRLAGLDEQGFVAGRDREIVVPLAAYGAVRQLLQDEGFWVDDL